MTPHCHCSDAVPAEVVVRMVPRRDAEPLSPAIRRATCLPGQADPCDVPCCSRHLDETLRAARTVLSVRALSDAVVEIKLTDKEMGS